MSEAGDTTPDQVGPDGLGQQLMVDVCAGRWAMVERELATWSGHGQLGQPSMAVFVERAVADCQWHVLAELCRLGGASGTIFNCLFELVEAELLHREFSHHLLRNLQPLRDLDVQCMVLQRVLGVLTCLSSPEKKETAIRFAGYVVMAMTPVRTVSRKCHCSVHAEQVEGVWSRVEPLVEQYLSVAQQERLLAVLMGDQDSRDMGVMRGDQDSRDMGALRGDQDDGDVAVTGDLALCLAVHLRQWALVVELLHVHIGTDLPYAVRGAVQQGAWGCVARLLQLSVKQDVRGRLWAIRQQGVLVPGPTLDCVLEACRQEGCHGGGALAAYLAGDYSQVKRFYLQEESDAALCVMQELMAQPAARFCQWPLLRELCRLRPEPDIVRLVLVEGPSSACHPQAWLVVRHLYHARFMHCLDAKSVNILFHSVVFAYRPRLLRLLVSKDLVDPSTVRLYGLSLPLALGVAATMGGQYRQQLLNMLRVCVEAGLTTPPTQSEAALTTPPAHSEAGSGRPAPTTDATGAAVHVGDLEVLHILYSTGAVGDGELRTVLAGLQPQGSLEDGQDRETDGQTDRQAGGQGRHAYGQNDHQDGQADRQHDQQVRCDAALAYLHRVISTPRCLKDLCRLTVSRLIGCRADRKQRALSLGLPLVHVQRILFYDVLYGQ